MIYPGLGHVYGTGIWGSQPLSWLPHTFFTHEHLFLTGSAIACSLDSTLTTQVTGGTSCILRGLGSHVPYRTEHILEIQVLERVLYTNVYSVYVRPRQPLLLLKGGVIAEPVKATQGATGIKYHCHLGTTTPGNPSPLG